MYSGSVAATETQGTGPAAAAASFQSTSRPAVMDACACGRCSTRHAAGLCCASRMASSSKGLYSTMRLTSMPQLALTMTLGRASSMRVASSLAAKPPNTTEWTAPRRAHARIATTASGTMGM